jgi:Uma2 family endonuclease
MRFVLGRIVLEALKGLYWPFRIQSPIEPSGPPIPVTPYDTPDTYYRYMTKPWKSVLLTFERFEQLPDEPGKRELLRGELIELLPAKLKHNHTAHMFYDLLKPALADLHSRGEATTLGEAWHEMGYQISAVSWFQPDVSITHAGQAKGDYFQGAPALAIEIVSESNTAEAIDTKIQDYLAAGALQVWVVYPKRRHLWMYETDGRAVAYSGRFGPTLLPGVELDLDAILADQV